MRTSIKTFAYAAAASMLLFACNDNGTNSTEQNSMPSSSNSGSSSSSESSSNSSFEVAEIPAMDSRVVSYKKDAIGYNHYETLDGRGFITDENILRPVFPHIFDNEQAECNYFAIYFVSASASSYYWILSQDMILYQIKPGKGILGGTTDIIYNAMLVCDDTSEGNLKDRIDINSTSSYTDSDWDYDRERVEDRNVFF